MKFIDHRKSFKKVILFIVIYMILIQLFMYKFVDSKYIYEYRMDYDLIKDRPMNIHLVLENIKREIEIENIQDYIILIGDSVGYSSPGKANQSIGYYMEESFLVNDKDVKVYNLSLPSNQTGDIYTILLMLDEYGIERKHIVINIIYGGFIERQPDPPLVFWFNEDIRRLDPETYKHILNSQIINGKADEESFKVSYKTFKNQLYRTIAITQHKDFIVAAMKKNAGRYETTWMNETGEPWMGKTFLRELLNDPLYQAGFTDKPFVMEETNLQIYFLNKIVEMQKDENLLVFMGGVNTQLLKPETDKPGYQANLDLINKFFIEKQVQFHNFYDEIDNNYYSDQIHFIPEGYEEIGKNLVEDTKEWFK